jgi:uncharacterized protein (DUF488 family)
MVRRLFTIGAYGWDAERYFEALEKARIDLFVDIRRRRGVRGREYSFANAGRLQAELENREIAYRHILDLAPEEVTRDLQSQADKASKLPRRQRAELGREFVEDYTHRTLDRFDFDALAKELKELQRPVLFCVERTPEACHRSLVAQRLSKAAGVPVTNLVP